MMPIMYSIFMCVVFIDCILQCSKTSNIYFIHSVSRGFNVMPPISGHKSSHSIVAHQEHAWCRVKRMNDAEKAIDCSF